MLGLLSKEKGAVHALIYIINGKHLKGTMNHQLQNFTPLGFVSYVGVLNIFWTLGEERRMSGLMPLGLFLLSV